MIIEKKNFFQGLNQLPTFITDTSKLSEDYLRLVDVPDEFVSGKNLIKVLGNPSKFKRNSNLYIEIIDAAGTVVHSEISDYFDPLKRRVIVINITDKIVYGQCIVTICGILRDDLVPDKYKNVINFKWIYTINIAPYKNNNTEIIYNNPPVVELSTAIVPYITKSFRNSEQTIVYEYGRYGYLDSNFSEYIGDHDTSDDIYQDYESNKLFVSYAKNPSITSFYKNNLYYLRDENYTAKSKVKNNPYILAKSFDLNSDLVGGLVTIYDTIDILPRIPDNKSIVSGTMVLNSASFYSYIDYILNNKFAGMVFPYTIQLAQNNSLSDYDSFLTNNQLVKSFNPNIVTGSFLEEIRFDYTASMSSLVREDGYIYHFNTILPTLIPFTSSLTDIVNSYIISELNISNLTPLTGDVSKIRILAKPKNDSGEYIDLGTYATKGTEVLVDRNYVNHVQYNESNYRLIGYFKPVILNTYDTSIIESSSFRTDITNFSDTASWNTGSYFGWVTSGSYEPYITGSPFRVNISGSNNEYINFTKYKLDLSPQNKTSRHYLVYIGEKIPKITSSLFDTNFQVSISVYARDTGSVNLRNGVPDLRPVRVKPAIFQSSSVHLPYTEFTEFPQSNDSDWLDDPDYGPFAGQQLSEYFTGLGWTTREFNIPANLDNLYMGVIIDEPSQDTLQVGQSVTINKILGREIGNRNIIIDTYWTASIINSTLYTSNSISIEGTTVVTSSNFTTLMDSARIQASTSIPTANYTIQKGTDNIIFTTKNWFKFYKGTSYILRFNACVKRKESVQYRNIIVNSTFDGALYTGLSQQVMPGWAKYHGAQQYTFRGDGTYTASYNLARGGESNISALYNPASLQYTGTNIINDFYGYGNDPLVGGTGQNPDITKGDYRITFTIISSSDLNNNGVRLVLADKQTNTYSTIGTHTETLSINPIAGQQYAKLETLFELSSSNVFPYVTRSIVIDNVIVEKLSSIATPETSTLKVWAINSGSNLTFNANQFYDLGIRERGEFVGELKHTYETVDISLGTDEVKYWTDIEMEFEASETGFGKIGFELDGLSEWYLSEISIKPKDRVGYTPNHSNIYLKIPINLITVPTYGDPIWGGNQLGYISGTYDIQTVPLTFKIEYLNDYDIKSNYITMLTDVQFTNYNRKQSDAKSPVINDSTGNRIYVTSSNNTIPPPVQ